MLQSKTLRRLFRISDFLQSFTFIQPYQTTRRADVITRRPTNKHVNKQNYQDTIFFDTDAFIKQRDTTTNKPRRKTKPTTGRSTTRSPWYQPTQNAGSNNQINNNGNNRNDNNNVYSNYDTNRPKDYSKQTTLRPIIYNNNFNVAQKPFNNFGATARPNGKRTTMNPLLHRPGVRPAVVDDNRPPITNRPITRPTEWPVTVKPESNRPIENDNTEAEIEIGPDEDDMSETEKRRFIEIAEQSKL